MRRMKTAEKYFRHLFKVYKIKKTIDNIQIMYYNVEKSKGVLTCIRAPLLLFFEKKNSRKPADCC